jgi:hypothetical protein
VRVPEAEVQALIERTLSEGVRTSSPGGVIDLEQSDGAEPERDPRAAGGRRDNGARL